MPLAWTLAYGAALPVACACSARVREVVRFRRGASPPTGLDRPVWVHAASVGEVGAARGLLAALPGAVSVLTVGTPEGLARAEREAVGDARGPVPLDLPGPLRSWVREVRPRALVLVESEIWPGLLAACREAGVPVAVAGGRMSAASAARHARWRATRSLLGALALVAAASPGDADRYALAGVPGDRIVTTGRLKWPAPPDPDDPRRVRIHDALAGRPAWVAGSVHADEADALRQAADEVRRRDPTAVLLLAPRHPGRYPVPAGAARVSDLPPGPLDPGRGVLCLDELGWLAAGYAEARVAWVGGGFSRRGAHDLLEPALSGCRVRCGPGLAGQEDVGAALVPERILAAVRQLHDLPRSVADAFEAGRPARRAAEEAVGHLDGRARAAEALRAAGMVG